MAVKNDFVADLNGKYKDIIDNTIRKKLGVEVDMRSNDNAWLTNYKPEDVDKKMRGNKILRSLFSSAQLYGYAYDIDREISVIINASYTHPNGGSNGHELLFFYIDKETNKVKVRR